jgi:hypothetical protein
VTQVHREAVVRQQPRGEPQRYLPAKIQAIGKPSVGRYHRCGLLKTAALSKFRPRRIICYLVDVQEFAAINGTKFQNRRAALALFAAMAAQQHAA